MKKILTKSFCFSCMTFMVHSAYADTAFSSASPWMFGDWSGKRVELAEKGYDFDFSYTGEMATLIDDKNSSGHGTEYAGQLALGVDFDLNKILGWQDTEAKIVVTYRDGQSLSNTSDALNGQLSSVQEIWGRGQTWRLTDLWVKKKFLDQKLDIKVGRFGEAEDFNSFDCDFQNLALCGSQTGIWTGDQWFNWPVSQWAMRVKYQLQPDLYAQIGVYEYNPENLKRGKGFNLSTDGSKGAMLPVEVVWSPHLTQKALKGEYRLGYYHSTADADVIDQFEQTSHHHGGWFTVKQQLTAHQDNPERGLTGFINLTFHDVKTNQIRDMQNLGVLYTGLMDQRPKDVMAIGIARVEKNKRVDESRKSEINTEFYYGLHVNDWFTIRPNIQYIRNIGGVENGNHAWVGGVKFNTVF